MEREPGTIIRDRYVLTAPFDGSVEALAWRAVDMVLRRRVVVVFDPPAPPDGEAVLDAGTGSDDDVDIEINTKREAGSEGNTVSETEATVDIDEAVIADIGSDSDGAGESHDPVPAAPPLPPDVPVGALLDGGHDGEAFYRVFHTGDADDTGTGGAAHAGLVPGEDDTHLALPLFAGDAIDGADATSPMGLTGPFRPPLLAAVPLPADPTTELPGAMARPLSPVAATGESELWWPDPPELAEPDPTKPWQPAVWALPALTAPVDAIPVRSTATRRRRSAGLTTYRPPQPKVRRPFPVSATAITVAGGLGLAGFLLARPAPSGSSPQLGPPPAIAEASPLVTTTLAETTTTTTTVPETTTTLPPTTVRRPPPTTAPPETTPPETEPPETVPPTTRPRSSTTAPRTTRPTPTTGPTLPPFPVINGGGPALT